MELKRTLEEVGALYRREPDLRDIFVEGSADKCFFDWYLHRKALTKISVYEIKHIDIPDEILLRHSLPIGSK